MTDDCKCKGVIGNLPAGTGGGAVSANLMPVDYMTGLEHQFLTTSTARILPGKCRDENNTYNIVSTSNLDADITATGANGRNIDSAETADKWYAFCIIAKSTDDTVASFLVNEDDWATAYTMPTGYDKIRRIGWIRNNTTSDFYKYRMVSTNNNRHIRLDELYGTQLLVNSAFPTTWTDVDCSSFAPPGCILTEIEIRQLGGSGDSYVHTRVNGSTNDDPGFRVISSSYEMNSVVFFQEVDTARIFEYKQATSGPDSWIVILGYMDKV